MSSEFADRLALQNYSPDDCLAAIRGERVPIALGMPLVRICVVRGIRYDQSQSAESEYAKELYDADPVFARALNARRIMNDCLHLLPDQISPAQIPYCIWYPRTASESTYRELYARHPALKYQIGRACAVANYPKLYGELDILPDVHIAEEARECGNIEIFKIIMAAPVRFDIMNDYTKQINDLDPAPACLDGNTAARYTLEIKQKFSRADVLHDDDDDPFANFDYDQGFENNLYNITEDMNIDEYHSRSRNGPQLPRYDVSGLLSEPLPQDLPTTDKRLLILMAAYYGNIERYTRLRYPEMIMKESECCIRGIYHNTQFARWWSRQPNRSSAISKAVNARFIVNNVLTIDESTKRMYLPYLIWYPVVANVSTYRELYRRQPQMSPQILRACIVGGYKDLFDQILAETVPDEGVWSEAKLEAPRDPYWEEQVLKRESELGIKFWRGSPNSWKLMGTDDLEYSKAKVKEHIDSELIVTAWDGFYDGAQCDAASVDFMTCLPEQWRQPPGQVDEDTGSLVVDYVNWPPREASGSTQ